MASRIRVRVHGSSANLGPGFDVFSIALDAFTDTVEAWYEHDGKGVFIDRIEGPYAHQVPISKNTALEAANLVIKKTGFTNAGIVLRIFKGVPPGKGLGSSGASAAAATIAASILTGPSLSLNDLVMVAGEAEAIVSGSPHYDNVAASILGGFVIVTSIGTMLTVRRIGLDALFLIAVPSVDLGSEKTRKMRSVIPERITLKTATRQWGKTALMAVSATRGDLGLFGSLMMGDEIVEPARSSLIPCYHDVRSAAIDAGALGVAVSGAGPSLLVLLGNSRIHADVEAVKKAVLEAYSGCGISVDVYVSRVGGGYSVLVSN